MSTPRDTPDWTALNATAPGSDSGAPATTVTLRRSPQTWSWSTAAARKVSAAPKRTVFPSDKNRRASLAALVVLPEPLTPTSRITLGRAEKSSAGGLSRRERRSARRADRSSSARTSPRSRARRLSESRMLAVVSIPTSAWMSRVSKSSHVSAVISVAPNSEATRPKAALPVLERPARQRESPAYPRDRTSVMAGDYIRGFAFYVILADWQRISLHKSSFEVAK